MNRTTVLEMLRDKATELRKAASTADGALEAVRIERSLSSRLESVRAIEGRASRRRANRTQTSSSTNAA